MKITELMGVLQDHLGKHGDVEVVSDSADGCLPIRVGNVQEAVDDDGNESKVLLMWGLESVEDDEASADQARVFEETRAMRQRANHAVMDVVLDSDDEPDEDAEPTVRYDSSRPPKSEDSP